MSTVFGRGIGLVLVLLASLLMPTGGRAEPIGGPFALTGPDGRVVRDADFRGQWLLVYFGYISCPDVCPTDLQRISEAMAALGPAAERVVPLFITLDPRRDIPERLAEYVKLFHPRMVGLAGTEAETDEVAKRYRVRFVRNPPDKNGFYGVDHTTNIYLIAPNGRFVEWYKMAVPGLGIAEAIRRQMARAQRE